MRIVNNTAAFNTWATYTTNVEGMKLSMNHLSTGQKTILDDAAGVGISERMRAQAQGSSMARNNVDNGISMIQTADSWLQKINDMLNRMLELAIESNDQTKTSTDRDNVNTEFKEMQAEIRRITSGTMCAAKFNGKALFQSASGFIVQVGSDQAQTISITFQDLQSTSNATFLTDTITTKWADVIRSSAMSIGGNVSVGQMAVNIRNISGAIDFIANTRASIGAQQKRFVQTREALLSYEDNIRAAESKIRDVDMARESTIFAKYQILSQSSNAMLAQANQLPSSVLQLLG